MIAKAQTEVSCEECGVSATITSVADDDPAFVESEKQGFLAAGGCRHAQERAEAETQRLLRQIKEEDRQREAHFRVADPPPSWRP